MTLPIRVRLTAWYAVLLALIIVGLGAFLVLRLDAELQDTIDGDVEKSSVPIARGYAREGNSEFRQVSRAVLPFGDSAAQVLDPDGRTLLSYGEPVARRPMATAPTRAHALLGERHILTVRLGPHHQRFREMVLPVLRHGHKRILVVAESLREIDQSEHQVLMLLLLAGPAALAATALAGWWLARKTLQPVQQMTAQAQEIAIDRLDERIEVPRTPDEIGRLASTLNAMLDRLQQGVQDKRQVIADASHDLRAPLTAMRAEIDVTLRGDELSPEARAVLQHAREDVDRMTRTVASMLTLAQIDEGRLELVTERMNLSEATAAAASSLRQLAAAKGVQVEVNGGESCETEADPQRLQEAITNYIENAIRFSPSGGVVAATTWRLADEVGVTVTDDGPGISPEARARCFDRVYGAERDGERGNGGSGLGLAISREIASAHGGRVWVESEEGKGSAFSLALPRSLD